MINKFYNTRWNIKIKPLIFLLTGCILSIANQSCSDEIEVNPSHSIIPEGSFRLNFSIPSTSIVKTRADLHNNNETAINNATVLTFDSNGTLLTTRNYGTEFQTPMTLKMSQKEKELDGEEITVYVIANTDLNGFNSTLAELEAKVVNWGNDNSFVMSGKTTARVQKSASIEITLNRLASKVTVEEGQELKNYTVTGFSIYNPAENVRLKDPETQNGTKYSNFITSTQSDPLTSMVIGKENPIYLNPSLAAVGQSDTADKSYVILSVESTGEGPKRTSYFCIFPRIEKEDGTYEYLNFEPNHWYQFTIEKIHTDGHPDIDSAVAKPELGKNCIEYVIHDHAASIMSMITDGIRELASDREINLTTTEKEKILSLKCFSMYSDKETPAGMAALTPEIMPEEAKDWLEVSNIPATSLETVGDHEGDPDNVGVQFQYTVKIKEDAQIFTDKAAIIRFEWLGLVREIPVNYSADFDVASACNVILTIKGEGSFGTQKLENCYWRFVSGIGDSPNKDGNENKVPLLYGIKKDAMADGKIRTQGFHFPMPYGENTNWNYEYEVNFSELENTSKTIKEIKVTLGNEPFFSDLIWKNDESEKSIVTLSLPSAKNNSYDYAIGELTFEIIYNQEEIPATYLTLDLYHTGFFHYDDSDEENIGYYYYEVVPLGDGSDHWLDRNLGAKSSQMYVGYDGDAYYGNSDAAGRFYKVADAGDFASPTMFNNGHRNNICPPGYHIPTSTEWDFVRNSHSLVSQRENDAVTQGNYYSTYIDCGKAGRVYFPKSRYNNQPTTLSQGNSLALEANSGSDATGYYWTGTESSGQEKTQIGKWLKTITFSGTSNTYINGSIQNYRMNVRCVAGKVAPEEIKHAIDFNVKGATHAYLYTIDNGKKVGLFDFPGKSIGNPTAVRGLNGQDETNYLHFSYNSNYNANQLYVYFAYMSKDGEIKVIYNKDETLSHENIPDETGITAGTELMTTQNFSLDDIEGWPVWVGANYFFTWTENNDDFDALDSTHIFTKNPDDIVVSNPTAYKYYFYWEASNSNAEMHFMANGEQKHPFSNNYSQSEENRNFYYITFISSSYDGEINYRVDKLYQDTSNGAKDNDVRIPDGMSYFSNPKDGINRYAYVKGNDAKTIYPGKPWFSEGEIVRIKWPEISPTGKKCDYIYVWVDNDTDGIYQAVGGWPGGEAKLDGEYYYFDVPITDQFMSLTNKTLHVIVNNKNAQEADVDVTIFDVKCVAQPDYDYEITIWS